MSSDNPSNFSPLLFKTPAGNATLKIDKELLYHLNLRAKTVDISPNCKISEKREQFCDDLVSVKAKTEGLGEQRVNVHCPKGHLEVLEESWFVLPDI